MIKVENIVKQFNDLKAVNDVSLEIKKGEIVCLIGPSGSGKSTVLRCINGLEKPESGHIYVNDQLLDEKDPETYKKLRSLMGFVFQQMYMLKNLSIYDNIVIPAYQSPEGKSREGRAAVNERAKLLMQKLSISEVADNDINEVSGGQLQRACICRSMINNPKIIFADEPTGALNKQNSAEVMEELNHINEEGTSILLVTHDMKVASKCERVLYIEDGDIRDEFVLGKWNKAEGDAARERRLNEWLIKLGW